MAARRPSSMSWRKVRWRARAIALASARRESGRSKVVFIGQVYHILKYSLPINFAAIGDDGDLHVARQANDAVHHVAAGAEAAVPRGAGGEDLGDSVLAREGDQRGGHVFASDGAGFDAQVARKRQMFFHRGLGGGRSVFPGAAHIDRITGGAVVIRDPLAPPYDHGGRGIGGDMNENPLAAGYRQR